MADQGLTLAVQAPQIVDLMEAETGRFVNALDIIGSDRDALLRQYKSIRIAHALGRDTYLCAACSVPVYMVSAPDREHFFFRHYSEDGNCPWITRGQLSEDQINALRYQGQRESARHIRIKEFVAESLRGDLFFSEPVIEGAWKGKSGKEYRRPDVRARYRNNLDIAFEVQLSTTFARVMAEREVFYKTEGGLLLWIFGEFDLNDTRLMMEVIFANNNRNAFVVNEATRDASVRDGVLTFECVWAEPAISNGSIVWTPKRRLARFDELTIDMARQRAYLVDTDQLESAFRRLLEGPTLAEQFTRLWLDFDGVDPTSQTTPHQMQARWQNLANSFRAGGVSLPWRGDTKFRTLVRALLMARTGMIVGWGYRDMWPAAHLMFDANKELLWIFLEAMRRNGRLATIEAQDKSGSWAKKMVAYRNGVADGNPAYAPDHQFDAFIAAAFPNLADYV
jgi:hypothetical protein